MGSHVTSPAPAILDGLTLIDLQLFGVFDVKTDESYASPEAQANDDSAPEDDSDGAAQDQDSDPQEPHNQDEDDADEAGVAPSESAQAGERTEGATKPEGGAQAAPAAPPTEGELILGKFKSQEALIAAYEEAQRQLGRLHREIAEQRRQTTQSAPEATSQPKEPEKTPEQIAQERRAKLQAFLKDPVAYERELVRQAQEEALRAIRQVEQTAAATRETVVQGIAMTASKYEDFAQMEAAVQATLANRPAFQRALATLQNNPNTRPEDIAALVDDAYHFAKAEIAASSLQAARDQGRREAQAAQTQRQQAAVASQGTRKDQTRETAEERIKREIREAGRSSGIWKQTG